MSNHNIDKENDYFFWCYLWIPFVIFALEATLITSAILSELNSSLQIQSLGVTSLSITNNGNLVDVTTTGLNATLSMTFKDATIVESLVVLVEYRGEMFSLAVVRPKIYHPTKQQIVGLEMSGVKAKQLLESGVRSIVKDLVRYKGLEFTVNVQGRVWRLKDGEDNKYEIQVVCKGVKVMFSPPYNMSNGLMINAPIQCFDLYANTFLDRCNRIVKIFLDRAFVIMNYCEMV